MAAQLNPPNSAAQPAFLAAARRQPVPYTPIWIMRQAGRYLPEYRALREKHGFLEFCTVPELCAEVTAQPIDRFGFDAAILFSDILIPVIGLGVPIAFAPGPQLEFRIERREDVAKLHWKGAAESTPSTVRSMPMLGLALQAWQSEREGLPGRSTISANVVRPLASIARQSSS